MRAEPVIPLLEGALASRVDLFDLHHESAFRLFNGFTEGHTDLVVDIFASTLVVQNYADEPEKGQPVVQEAAEYLQAELPWLRAGILKLRHSHTQAEKRGTLFFGEKPDQKIREHGIWYAIDLTINRDTSLYLDARNLRKWVLENTRGKSVANFFAYTGSLGVAALAGGANRVLQLDLNPNFLDVARMSCTLNGFPVHDADFRAGDFFEQVGKFKRSGESFDCVIVDPPFFSTTSKGRIDQEHESMRIINKVRPLLADGGVLIAINNALYVSGKEWMQTLESVCKDGYVKIMELIPVPEDFTGYPGTRSGQPITDPYPFNHSTKMAALKVRRK